MGKKVKTGKARKDKYYKLAKETGYRSRAAFKLIQLNRKFSFLQNSRVVLDLCAAPGGWLQVAAQNTPLSSIIVGVDLVAIPSIRRVTTIQEDITSDKCRKELKKIFQKWHVDCVLHDGAPNVGQNWVHDAYQQATLTLAAVKMCTVFLKKGGWFITKMFRSKDYNSLQWVLSQLFRNVHATKPQASRTESSEVYVVCQGYLAPDKIDQKFLDMKHVFKDIDEDRTKLPQLDLRRPGTVVKQKEGYPEGETLLFHTMAATEFFTCANHLERLADVTKIVLDDDEITNHPLTTPEIKSLCEDIKVINKRDINRLIKWRKAYLKEKQDENKQEKPESKEESDNSEAEEAALDVQIKDMKERERLEVKRKLKKTKQEKSLLKSKMEKSGAAAAESGEIIADMELFTLTGIKTQEQLSEVTDGDLTIHDADYTNDNEEKPSIRKRPADVCVDREVKEYMEDTDDDVSVDEDDDYMCEGEARRVKPGRATDVTISDSNNPLVMDLEEKVSRSTRLLSEWFSKDSFAGIEDEHDHDVEIDKMVEDYKRKGGQLTDKEPKKPRLNKISDGEKTAKNRADTNIEQKDEENDNKKDERVEESEDSDYSDADEEARHEEIKKNSADIAAKLIEEARVNMTGQGDGVTFSGKAGKIKRGKEKNIQANGFEIVPVIQTPLPTSLDEVGLALGAAIASSRKRRREIIEDGYNRFMYDDTYLPSWFVREEQSHRARPLPITKEEVKEYKQRQKEIDARPIKKIAEAKARKKRRLSIKIKKARKRAEGLDDTQDVSEKEKWSQIKQIYKKAGLLSSKKKDVTYVVAKKGGGNRVSRPAGVKGHYKVVDPRGKKDKRNAKTKEQKTHKKKQHHSRR